MSIPCVTVIKVEKRCKKKRHHRTYNIGYQNIGTQKPLHQTQKMGYQTHVRAPRKNILALWVWQRESLKIAPTFQGLWKGLQSAL